MPAQRWMDEILISIVSDSLVGNERNKSLHLYNTFNSFKSLCYCTADKVQQNTFAKHNIKLAWSGRHLPCSALCCVQHYSWKPGVCSSSSNLTERQIFMSFCSVDFHTLTLQLPIQTPNSVVPELQVFVSSLQISAKQAHPGWFRHFPCPG